MESGSLLYLSRADVESVGLTMREIIDALDAMFREKGQGKVEMPPKPGIHPAPDAFIHAMPAYIPSLESAGIKWVAGFPENEKRGLPYISGLLVQNDAQTGMPLAVMDCTWNTAKRTGAATAVAAKYLARQDSTSVGVLACGVQGRSNLEAVSCLFDVRKVKAYDIVPEVARTYAREMSETLGVEVEPVSAARDAVQGMDMVVTSGPILKHPSPTIEAGWVAEGAFASAVDFDSYWHGDALREFQRLATDDLDQMAYYRSIGYFQDTPEPYADLGELAAGLKPGRASAQERIMAMNLGLALDDMATSILIYRKACEKGIGIELPL